MINNKMFNNNLISNKNIIIIIHIHISLTFILTVYPIIGIKLNSHFSKETLLEKLRILENYVF